MTGTWSGYQGWGDLAGLSPYWGRLHSFGSEHCTVKADLWLPYPTLAAIKYDAVLCYCLHEVDEVLAMLLSDMAIATDVTMDGFACWEIVSDLVLVHLEDVSAHIQTEGHMQELVPSLVGIEGGWR